MLLFLTMMLSNSAGLVSRPTTRTGIWKACFGVRRRLAELAGGNLDILLDQRVDHIGCGKAAGRQANRIEPDTHGVFALAEDHHIAYAGHALERIFHVDVKVVGDELGRVSAVASEKSRRRRRS